LPTAPTQAFYGTYCNPATPFPTCTNPFGNARRNILSSPGYHNFDFSLYQNTRVSERVNTQFRAEFFSILNHPNFQGAFDTNTIDQAWGSAAYERRRARHSVGVESYFLMGPNWANVSDKY
jgi:hypothetical protein